MGATAEAKPGAKGVPFDQRLAALLVRPLAGTPVRPNHLTALSLALAALAAWLLARGDGFGWGAGLFMLAVFTDHTDGDLARLTGRSSRFG
jgi:phosphatidylglycerophosphate synthase